MTTKDWWFFTEELRAPCGMQALLPAEFYKPRQVR